jgi:rfaE bifunctional protein kinase chain/domain
MTDLHALVPKLAGRRIVVVGDVILDEYLTGRAMRLSREAPIPVLEFEQRQLLPGGAANPAANVTALGSHALQIGVIGADGEATALRQVLQARGIDIGGLVVDASRPTTVKTRIMAHMGLRFPQQVARMDRLSRARIAPAIDRALIECLDERIEVADAVLFSDYDGGAITAALVETARLRAARKGVLLAADAQGKFDLYARFTLIKCNADEARHYLRRDIRTDDEFAHAALDLCKKLELTGAMVITRGADGVTVGMANGEAVRCPSPAITDVYDTVGAGDTAIAVTTLALIAGASPVDAAMLANYASGLVVRRVGNYAPTPDELLRALDSLPYG